MADNFPVNFPIPQSSALANYNYTDVAEGTGVVIFYGGCANTSTGETYFLTDKNIISSTPEFSAAVAYSATGVFTEKFNKSFSASPFNSPRIVMGTAYISIPTASNEADDGLVKSYCVVTIQKNSGGSLSTLVTATSNTFTPPAAVVKTAYNFLVPLVIPQTHFKRGDILIVNISLWGYTTHNDTANSKLGIAFDPSNNYTTYTYTSSVGKTSRLSCYIPFKLNL